MNMRLSLITSYNNSVLRVTVTVVLKPSKGCMDTWIAYYYKRIYERFKYISGINFIFSYTYLLG